MNSANYEVDATFEVFTAVEIEVEFSWIVTPCIVVVGYPEELEFFRLFHIPCFVHCYRVLLLFLMVNNEP